MSVPAQGLELSPHNVVDHHDFSVRQIWQPRRLKETAQSHVIEFDSTPNEQAWSDLDSMNLGQIWHEEVYPAIALAYLPTMQVNWQALRHAATN